MLKHSANSLHAKLLKPGVVRGLFLRHLFSGLALGIWRDLDRCSHIADYVKSFSNCSGLYDVSGARMEQFDSNTRVSNLPPPMPFERIASA